MSGNPELSPRGDIQDALTPADVAEIEKYAAMVEADPELAPVSVLFPEWVDIPPPPPRAA